MSADKKKSAKKKKHSTPTGEFRHADGDRRHKAFGAMARDAQKNKELLQQIGAVDLPDDEEGEDQDSTATS